MTQTKPNTDFTLRNETYEGERGWWIWGEAKGIDWPVGPYGTKAEAQDILRGIKRFLKMEAKA